MKNYSMCIWIALFFLVIMDAGAQHIIPSSAGAKISYSVIGKGRPLLLINGGPGYTSRHLMDVAKTLSERYQVIVYDQRGTGKSTVPDYNRETINLNAYLEDIEAIRSSLKLSEWIIAGHSFGGLLACAYTSKHPDKVSKLLLISSAGPDLQFANNFQDNIVNVIGDDTIHYELDPPFTPKDWFLNSVRVNAPAYVFDKTKTDAIRSALVSPDDFVYEVNFLLFNDLLTSGFDVKADLSKYQKPALIIQGAQDIVGMDTAYRTKEALPQSEIYFLPRCGHVPWLEQPRAFFREVTAFLSQE